MGKIYKTIGAGLIALLGSGSIVSLPTMQAEAKAITNLATLQGTVLDEKYVPRVSRGCDGTRSSEYFFSINTEHGKKLIELIDYCWFRLENCKVQNRESVSNEAMDVLISKGATVNIECVPEKYLKNQKLSICSYQIEVLDN